jgi:hypothetical protein
MEVAERAISQLQQHQAITACRPVQLATRKHCPAHWVPTATANPLELVAAALASNENCSLTTALPAATDASNIVS